MRRRTFAARADGRRARRLLVAGAVLATMLGAPPAASAGAWTQPRGRSYLELRSSYLSTDGERDFRGKSVPLFVDRAGFTDGRYRQADLRLYAEYGLTGRVTLVGKLPLRAVTSERTELGGVYFDRVDVENSTNGLGDLGLGARLGVIRAPVVVSVETGLKIPAGYDARPDDDGPPLGNGEVDADVRLLVGAGLGRLAYATGGAGYRRRGGVYHDEILYEGEIGWEPGNWLLQGGVDAVRNTRQPQDLAGTPIVTPLPGGGGSFVVIVGDQDWTKARVALSRRVAPGSRLKVFASDVVQGRNTIDGTEIGLALVLTR